MSSTGKSSISVTVDVPCFDVLGAPSNLEMRIVSHPVKPEFVLIVVGGVEVFVLARHLTTAADRCSLADMY